MSEKQDWRREGSRLREGPADNLSHDLLNVYSARSIGWSAHMSIEDRQWYKEDFDRRRALPDPLKRRLVRFTTTQESAPDLSLGLISWLLFFLVVFAVLASHFLL